MERTAASLKNLETIKDVDRELAKRVRAVWRGDLDAVRAAFPDTDKVIDSYYHQPGARELRRVIIDKMIDTCGVEYLGQLKRSGEHVYYCNAGDTYAGTILFIGQRLVVGCWGDLVERNRIVERETF